MGIPQIVYIALTAISLGITMAQHGKPNTGKTSLWTYLVSQIITYSILIWGGFFN